MAWPKGKSRKEAMAAKAASETEVMSPEPASADGNLHNEQPASRPSRLSSEARAPNPAKQTWTMKAGNNWDNAVEVEDSPDRLAIPPELIPEGMALEFKTRSVLGQEQQQRLNGYFRAGWTPVHAEDFGGRFANMWSRDDSGYVVYEACILCARPLALSIKAKKRELAKARDQIALKEQAFKGGEIAATGADHPTAKGFNRISRTMERIEIPKD